MKTGNVKDGRPHLKCTLWHRTQERQKADDPHQFCGLVDVERGGIGGCCPIVGLPLINFGVWLVIW